MHFMGLRDFTPNRELTRVRSVALTMGEMREASPPEGTPVLEAASTEVASMAAVGGIDSRNHSQVEVIENFRKREEHHVRYDFEF
jgi:hypothetical protein